MAMNPDKVKEKTVSAAGQATEAHVYTGYFNASVQFLGAGTIALQRSFDGGTHWKTVASYTTDTETVIQEPEDGVSYRLYCSAYSAGQILCRLSQ